VQTDHSDNAKRGKNRQNDYCQYISGPKDDVNYAGDFSIVLAAAFIIFLPVNMALLQPYDIKADSLPGCPHVCSDCCWL